MLRRGIVHFFRFGLARHPGLWRHMTVLPGIPQKRTIELRRPAEGIHLRSIWACRPQYSRGKRNAVFLPGLFSQKQDVKNKDMGGRHRASYERRLRCCSAVTRGEHHPHLCEWSVTKFEYNGTVHILHQYIITLSYIVSAAKLSYLHN